MLLLVRSRGVVFTAFITSTLSRTVQGQVMMIMIMAPATGGTSAVSSSLLVLFVKFVKLVKETSTMSIWRLYARQVCVSEQLF